MLYVGLDVHYRTTTCCILAEDGRPVKTKTFKGPWKKTVDYLRSFKEDLAVCFEASVGYGPLYEALTGFCKRVQVAHPGNLRLIFRSKRKNDRVDAQKIAKLLYLDEVPAVHVPDQDARAWRELIEFRRRSVDKRTKVKNQLRCLLRAYALHVPKDMGLWTKNGLAWLEQLDLPTTTARVKRRLLLDELAHLEKQVKELTRELDRIARNHPGVALLMTIPGVGPRTAAPRKLVHPLCNVLLIRGRGSTACRRTSGWCRARTPAPGSTAWATSPSRARPRPASCWSRRPGR